MTVLELRAELSKVQMKRNHGSEVIISALSTIKNKCEDAKVSVDEI